MATYANLKEWAANGIGSPLKEGDGAWDLSNSDSKGNQDEFIHWLTTHHQNGQQHIVLVSQSLVKQAKGASGLCTRAALLNAFKAKHAVIEDWSYTDSNNQLQQGFWVRLPGGHKICSYTSADAEW